MADIFKTAKGMFANVATSAKNAGSGNTLAPAGQFYRVTLRMGSIDDLFPDEITKAKGRMERLQVLGLFYYPLNHALSGKALEECWKWVEEHIKPKTKSSRDNFEFGMEEFVLTALEERVVACDPSPFKDVGSDYAEGGLPVETPGAPAPGDFAKIRIPGGYSMRWSLGSSDVFSQDSDPDYWSRLDGEESPELKDKALSLRKAHFPFGMEDSLFDHERAVWSANRALGKVPLVAKVERGPGVNGPWQPVNNATVGFQLIEPYEWKHGPDYDRRHLNTHPDVEDFIAKAENTGASSLDPKHPLKGNCHHTWGGQRGRGDPLKGTGVGGVVFSIKETPGFNAPHKTGRKLHRYVVDPAQCKKDRPDCRELHHDVPLAFLPPDPKTYPYAVWAQVNEDGEAGVIFTPSRMGGDRYRIRAYVAAADGKTLFDGKGTPSWKFDTGTMVVWRNIRISRFLRKATSDSFVYEKLWKETEPYSLNIHCGKDYLAWAGLSHGFTHPKKPLDTLRERFRTAFCEIEFDFDPDSDKVEEIPPEDYVEAYKTALSVAEAGMPTLPPGGRFYDLRRLFLSAEDAAHSDVVALFPMHSPRAYNEPLAATDESRLETTATGLTDAAFERVTDIIYRFMFPTFMRKIAKNGFLPGLTILQAGIIHSWGVLFAAKFKNPMALGGHATPYGAVAIFYGKDLWEKPPSPAGMDFDYAGLLAHELGHCLHRPHAPFADPGEPGAADGEENTEKHSGNDCVMAYKCCPDAEFCAKCLLALRGYDIV
ncbi:MAG: hypothetical protein HYY17_12090 [Planctomycetes bacterium]|nr:hypothetical protein [Planctomycetota bacterium]